MEGNLFSKYQQLLDSVRTEKKEISKILTTIVGLVVDEKQIIIKGKEVTLFLSSTQRVLFIVKKGGDSLKEKGYIVKLS